MRFFLVVLTLLLCGGPYAFAEDILLGRVVSADRGKGEITITLLEAPERYKQSSPAMESSAEPKDLTVATIPDRFPSEVRPGMVVRIWGHFEEDTYKFVVEKMAIAGSSGPLSDPTGVRRRLGSRHRGSYGGTIGRPPGHGSR